MRGEKSNPYFPTVDMSVDIVDWQEMMHYIDDALGVCAGLSSFPLKPPYHIHNYPKMISAATGIDMTKMPQESIRKEPEPVRAVNVRRGLSREDEKPPEDHWKKRFPELEAQLLDAYYKFKGWNMDGIPTKETLQNLNLGYVAEDLEQRGIIKDGQEEKESQNNQDRS
jgi:aldehyde:ferredoxin oxidoreductase